MLCVGFPWKIPRDALAVPRPASSTGIRRFCLGIAGRVPRPWAIRNGETEVGFTFHYMDAELDTGRDPRPGLDRAR